MPTSVQRAQQKQHSIVTVAESLFLQQGYSTTSMDQIADSAGVTKQTVYRYFPSKENLFAAVMKLIQTTELQPYCFGKGPIRKELAAFGNYLLEFHLQPRALGLYRLMMTEGHDAGLYRTFNSSGPGRILQPLVKFLEQRCHVDDADFCARMFATMILVPRNHLLMSGEKTVKKPIQQKHVSKVTDLFMAMVQH